MKVGNGKLAGSARWEDHRRSRDEGQQVRDAQLRYAA